MLRAWAALAYVTLSMVGFPIGKLTVAVKDGMKNAG